jgi:hypothetical protein
VRDAFGWEAVELLLASSPEAGATGAAADPTREARLKVYKQEDGTLTITPGPLTITASRVTIPAPTRCRS